MPQCKKCSRVAATAEMRRSPKEGWLCKDTAGCAHDRKIKAKGEIPGPRSLQQLLRF
jgi:hypothetical protein